MARWVVVARMRRVLKTVLLALVPLFLQANSGADNGFDARVLAAHNRERDSMGLRPLAWDPGLARFAAGWGAKLARSGTLEHSGGPLGENLWAGTVDRYTPEEMIGLWIDEKKLYKPGVFPAISRTGSYEDVGHYTQLMWRTTGKVGCALAKGRQFDVLVCEYSRPGNVEGERPF